MSNPIGSIIIKRDGNMFFAHFDDFQNLQESPAGFGYTISMAIEDLSASSGQRTGLSEFSLTGPK
jgi:hypothetical protein